MTPSPEHVGPGLVDVDAERKLAETKAEINTIIKNAISNVKTDGKALLTGIIAEREWQSESEFKEYFHPVILIEDRIRSVYDDNADEDIALGGQNFSNLFPMKYFTDVVDWGGTIGVRDYRSASPDDGNPFAEFFKEFNDGTYLDLTELKINLKDANFDNDINAINNGEVADYILPKTVGAGIKYEIAQRILEGLKNAGGIK